MTPPHALLIALLARGHVLPRGVARVGKTTLAKALATTLGCFVRRSQFTPALLPSDITGTYVFNPRDATFSLRLGPIYGHVVFANESNRAPATNQSAPLEAMQEQKVTIEEESYVLPNPFLVLASQNPIDLAGTYTLPEAQLDRFLMRLRMTHPHPRDEVARLRSRRSARCRRTSASPQIQQSELVRRDREPRPRTSLRDAQQAFLN